MLDSDVAMLYQCERKLILGGYIMKEVCLKIKGMHCEGCSTRLERVLNNQDGVEKAKVSLENAEADIKFDDSQISVDELKEAVEDAGFEAE